MPRSIWNGAITFGLISVPIKVHSATEDRTVHFHQVHAKDGAAIKQKRICSKEEREVPYEEVVKGYEVRQDEYVVLSQDEIKAAAGEAAHVIALEEFVCARDIDPVFYDHTYHLSAGDGGADAYRLLHDALGRSERAGIGRWVFHNREYLVTVRNLDGALALHTMHFAAELVPASRLEVPQPSRKPSQREIEMAGALVDSLHDKFEPAKFHDEHRERVLEMIERKARGEKIEVPREEPAEQPGDLLAALEASLKSSGKSGTPRKSGTARKTKASGAKSGKKPAKAGKR